MVDRVCHCVLDKLLDKFVVECVIVYWINLWYSFLFLSIEDIDFLSLDNLKSSSCWQEVGE